MTIDTSKLKYSKSHEWAKIDGKVVAVGITNFAQQEIRDIVFIELPKIGREVKQGEPCCVIESVKAAFDVYAPVSGKIIAANDAVTTNVTTVHQDPYGNGWLFQIEANNPAELNSLMNETDYNKMTAEAHH